jgi:ATP-dependent Lhr-like helicase
VPTFLDDAMELTAIVQGMRDGDVEPTLVVHNALDVLAQVIVAAVSVDEWDHRRISSTWVRRAYPYQTLTRAAFDEVLGMLAGKYPSELGSRARTANYLGPRDRSPNGLSREPDDRRHLRRDYP